MPLTVVCDILCDAVLLLVACRGRASYVVGHTHANLSDKFTQSRLLVASSIVLRWCLLVLLATSSPWIYIRYAREGSVLVAIGNVASEGISIVPLNLYDSAH